MPDEIKGETPVGFVILEKFAKPSDALSAELISLVGKKISPIAKPSKIIYVDDLPKTRSGKIVRRIIKKIMKGEKELGDVSTIANPESIRIIKKSIK